MPSVKMEVLRESSEPQLLLALSEAFGRAPERTGGLGFHCFRVASMRPGGPSCCSLEWGADGCGPCLRIVIECSVLPLAGSQHHGSMGVSPATRGSCATGKQLLVALDRGTAQGHSPPP